MQRTGPTNPLTRTLAVRMDKHAKKNKSGIYAVLAQLLTESTRSRAEVNLDHLNKMGEKFKDKVLVVPGKVLAKGDVTIPLQVAAFRFSETAKQKIENAKGKTLTFDQLISTNIPTKNMVLVK